MFGWFKKKKKEEVKEEISSVKEEVQNLQNGVARGLYCPVCGYMEVREDSNELPMEGFAICPNCGDDLKHGWFRKNADESYSLLEYVEKPVGLAKKKLIGGHYRVRPAGPARKRHKGNPNH